MVHPRSSSLSSSTCYPCSHQNLKETKEDPSDVLVPIFSKTCATNSKYVVYNVGLYLTNRSSLSGKQGSNLLFVLQIQVNTVALAHVVR